MNEWEVFGVIVALIGFAAAIIRPIVKLTKSITKLDMTCTQINAEFKRISNENKTEHKDIHAKDIEQDKILQNHEIRIDRLERHKGEQNEL